MTVFIASLGITAIFSEVSGIVWVTAVIAGVANGLSAGIVFAIGADISPDKGGEVFAGLFRFVVDLGEFFGPSVCGVLIANMSLGWSFIIISLLSIAGLFAWTYEDIIALIRN